MIEGGDISDAALAVLAWHAAVGVDDIVTDTPADWATLSLKARAGSPAPSKAPLPPAASPARTAPSRAPPVPQPAAMRDASLAQPPGWPPADDEFDPPAPRRTPVTDRPPSTTHASIHRAVPIASDAAVMEARAQAATADSLDALKALLERFEGCGLKATAKSLCFYRGAETAPVMVIGEAPGSDEDRAGLPFVGKAGKLLDKMLAAIGLDETSAHITNVVYWRPPGNRTPTPLETQVCQPFLERQIELVAPQIILCVGGAAAKQVLDTPEGIMRLRGKWRQLASGARQIKVMPTLHPAYLLRTPAAKRMAWRDLMAVRDALDGKT